MDSNLSSQFLLFVISLIANAFSAFSGGGAGLIQFPVLIFLGLSFAVALATHKVATVALGIGATIRHMRENTLERNFTLFILATGLPGVVLGASLILRIPDRGATIALGILVIGLGVYSWFKKDLGQSYTPQHRNRSGYLIGGALLFFIGHILFLAALNCNGISVRNVLNSVYFYINVFGFKFQTIVCHQS